ncbi:MAG: hypothetical protein K2Z81_22945, partial [Cyanobacteria bacterium]|nr:hypothetical protein [Cyanobacteriota bacterium]
MNFRKTMIGFVAVWVSTLSLTVGAAEDKKDATAGTEKNAAAAEVKDAKAVKVERLPKAPAKDDKVKDTADINNSKTPRKMTAPPSKGGPKSRGAIGIIWVDNRENLRVCVWIDGYFEGIVGPYA